MFEGGSLKVATTNFRDGYLRNNGVPYSENASLLEQMNIHYVEENPPPIEPVKHEELSEDDKRRRVSPYGTIKLDSLWTPVVKFLATLPETYDQDEAYDRYRAAREGSIDASWEVSENRQRVRVYRLTPFGRKRLAAERSRWEQLSDAIAGIFTPPLQEET